MGSTSSSARRDPRRRFGMRAINVFSLEPEHQLQNGRLAPCRLTRTTITVYQSIPYKNSGR
jgi:hypothetical protein